MNEVSLDRFKVCTKCGCTKPLTPSFWHRQKHAKSGFTGRCKRCREAEYRQWATDNPERIKAHSKRQAARKRAERKTTHVVAGHLRWTAEADEVIRRRYPHEPTENLLTELPTTTAAGIKTRAQRLGVRKTPEYRRARLLLNVAASVAARNPELAEAKRDAPEGHKPCGTCLRTLPATSTYFRANQTHSDGLSSQCKACADEAQKRYYEETRGEHLEYYRKRYRENREAILPKQKAYRDAHKEEMAEYKRKWEQRNRERVRANHRNWRANRTEEQLEAERQWRREYAKRNRLQLNAKARRRRVLVRGAEGSHTVEEVWQMSEDQDHLCAYCETPLMGDFHVDHLVPLSKGGSDYAENLAIACALCNVRKSSLMPLQFLKRLGYSVLDTEALGA